VKSTIKIIIGYFIVGQPVETRSYEIVSNNKVIDILKIPGDKCDVKINFRVFLGYVYKLLEYILMFQDIETTAD
jgi:hypothetical protein